MSVGEMMNQSLKISLYNLQVESKTIKVFQLKNVEVCQLKCRNTLGDAEKQIFGEGILLHVVHVDM